ncbi:MAG: glycosyltransferase family 9 protein [Desulfobacteraceae bacterium]|jgi:ADP-heptose:LPS heptosyltransferase|nr:glycosyltransferase family 9 protein [Desulfobacteraceae bacterium]
MKFSFYREKWSAIKGATVAREEISRLSRQIAHSFMDSYLKDCHYEEDYIDLLCEMTTFSEDTNLTGLAAQALFRIIIESLCDDFEDLQTETYNRVMAQLISFGRKLPSGRDLDNCLNDFKIFDHNDLLNRIKTIRGDGKHLACQQDVKKILLLSRVTIGADVAITSIIIQRLAKLFPKTEIVLIGGSKLDEVYGGNPRIRLQTVDYNRKGGLIERLSSWQLVLQIIKQELTASPLEDTILIDPDSRLSQLGVLPIIPEDHYFFFDSRSDISFASNMSMAQLTNTWINALTGEEDFCYPKIWPRSSNLTQASGFYSQLKKCGARKVVVTNFGVGGNQRKKVGSRLEKTLLLSLLQEPDTVIVLDKGFGDQELRDSNLLLEAVKDHGFAVREAAFGTALDNCINSGVIGMQTRIGEIAALIAKCDEYIGYDSACQHIAAALEIPCLTIFAGSNNMRFIRRWSAFGPNSCQIVHVDTLTDPAAIDVEDIITRIMNQRRMR